MKKLISCLLTLFLLLCPTSLAEEEREVRISGGYSYAILADGTAEITRYAGFSKALEIPSEIDGRKVTGIGDYAFFCSSLTTVTIPDSVTSIGSSAFCGCRSLTAVTIPDSVKSIGDDAFSS